MTAIKFKVGRPMEFTPEEGELIIEQFKLTLVLSNVSGQVGRSKDCIKRWLALGKKDLDDNLCTDIAQFYVNVKKANSTYIRSLEDRLIHGDEKNWQRIAWYLERCAREDYGADAGIIEDILAEFKAIKEARDKTNG